MPTYPNGSLLLPSLQSLHLHSLALLPSLPGSHLFHSHLQIWSLPRCVHCVFLNRYRGVVISFLSVVFATAISSSIVSFSSSLGRISSLLVASTRGSPPSCRWSPWDRAHRSRLSLPCSTPSRGCRSLPCLCHSPPACAHPPLPPSSTSLAFSSSLLLTQYFLRFIFESKPVPS